MCSLAPYGKEKVTSVGNAWIICRSKSFGGRVYYFNTLTGEAVWNLSESEVEKAKSRTKILQTQPGFVIDNCPEPPESPQDNIAQDKQLSGHKNQIPYNMFLPNVYNKQVINNRFPTSSTLCTSHQYSQCNPIGPIPFNIPVTPALNPAIWNVPPQQIFVTPTNHQPVIKNNNFDNFYLNNMSNTLNDRFKRYSEIQKIQHSPGYDNQKFNHQIRPNKYQHHRSSKKYGVNKFKKFKNKMDLRYILSLKRRENEIKRKEAQLKASEVPILNQSKTYCSGQNDEEEEFDDDNVNNSNGNWLENLNYTRSQKQAGHRPFNMRRRSFSTNQEENDKWLDHLNNINIVATKSDVKPHTSQMRRRSHSFSANEEENDEDKWVGHSNNLFTDAEERGPNFLQNIETYSSDANERGNENEWLIHSNSENNKHIDVYPVPSHSRSYSLKLNDEDGCNDDNNEWLEHTFKGQGDKDSLERKTPKHVLQVKESSDITYVIPDSNVFLNNINLLDEILNEDKQTCLLVPQIVMRHIQSATKSHCRALAYKALSFIWQQYEANLAIIEEDSEENESDNDLLKFCNQLVTDQQIHVILLTDDARLIDNSYTTTNIHIITTAKMKQIINECNSNETSTTNLDTEALANVKIVVENASNTDKEIIESSTKKYVCVNSIQKIFDEKNTENLSPSDVSQNDKKACDVGVQASIDNNAVTTSKVTNDFKDEVVLPDSTKTNDNMPYKIDGIVLRQNLFNDFSQKTKVSDSKKGVWQRKKDKLMLAKDRTRVGNRIGLIWPETNSMNYQTALSEEKTLTWSLFSNTSTESLYKQTEGSDTSSVIYRNVNQRENITIDDTSNSVISNTTSNVDSESERGGVRQTSKVTDVDDRIVMFPVTDVRMEEVLRVKMEEWVSRLVQIMEEALSQLLQREPSFALEPMPPPWTVHEATECVKKHFCHDPDVVDASDRLLAVSRDHGGLRGKINSNISPHKYMELYSYGVYLIDALQGVLSSNEDLQSASEALSKLLSDIQESHLNQDSFTDISAHELETKTSTDKENTQIEVCQGDNTKENLKESPKRNKKKQITPSIPSTPGTPGKYNLRSQTKKIEIRDASDNVTFIRTIDPEASFFSSLDLKKININNTENATEKSKPINEFESSHDEREKNASPSIQKTIENNNSSEESTNPILNDDPIMNEPKIIRQFFKCPKYEEKLKYETGIDSDYQDNWAYDDEYEGRLMIDDQDFSEEFGNQDSLTREYYTDFNDDLWCNDDMLVQETPSSSLQAPKTFFIDSENVTFKFVMEKLESILLKAFSSIQDFCVRSGESLHTDDLSADDLREMHARAEKTSSYICKTCDQLQNVLTRENSNESIFQILRRNEFADVVVEDGDIEVYRDFISKCLEQGSILKESVELVLLACKLKAA